MHIKEEDLRRFHQSTLKPDEVVTVLKHIETCTFCAERLMEMESDSCIHAPSYLKDQLITRTQMVDVKTKVHMKTISKQVELLLYGLKTTAAVIVALILLFSVNTIRIKDVMDIRNELIISFDCSSQLYEKSNRLVDVMSHFSNRIVDGGRTK